MCASELTSPRLALRAWRRAASAHRGREFDDNFCHFLTEQLVPLWETTRQFDPSFSKDNLCDLRLRLPFCARLLCGRCGCGCRCGRDGAGMAYGLG